MKLLRFFLFLGLLAGCSTRNKLKIHEDFDFGLKRPIIAAHRAEHSIHSENSLEAIKAASGQNISLIEIDIKESADGILFLFHNKNIDPQTVQGPQEFVGRPFSSLSSDQIRSLTLPQGERVPSFDEVLVQTLSSKSSLLLDIKGGAKLREKVISAIRRRTGEKVLWFLCYDLSCISQIREADIDRVDVIARMDSTLSISQALSIRPKIIQIDCDESCSQKVSLIKSQAPSTLVLAKTLKPSIDNKNIWKSFLEKGVDIILTDKPLELRNLQMY